MRSYVGADLLLFPCVNLEGPRQDTLGLNMKLTIVQQTTYNVYK